MSTSVGLLQSDDTSWSAAENTLKLEILGSLRLSRDGVEVSTGPPQRSAVLAVLLARAGRPTSTTDLVDLIWADDAPASAVNVIHKYVGSLRRLLEPGLPPRATGSYLRRRGSGYVFSADPGRLDLLRFRDLVKQAQACLADGHEEAALRHYAEALALWRGPAGGDLARATTSPVFAPLDGEFFDACQAAADLALSRRQPARVLPALRLAAALAPLHEPVHAALISVLAAAGQQAEALAAFRGISSLLADDLGIDPGEALQAAQRDVLRGSLAAAAPPPARGAAIPLVRPAQLPPDLSTFVGRHAELATLAELCAQGDGGRTSPLIVALDGMSGVGKSTLAAHFAHGVAEAFTDGQLYLDLHGREAGEALRSLLSSLGVPAGSDPETVEARTGVYRSLTAGKRILVVLDNVRDASQVRPLLPNSARSLVLITSRAPLVGLAALEGAHLLHVGLPDPASARALLRCRLSGSSGRTATDAAQTRTLDRIIESCGRLPLALAIIAGRLSARPSLSLDTVAAELRDGARKLTALSGGRGVSDPRTAFSWSYGQLSDRAARLFRLSSVAFAPGLTAEAAASLAAESPRLVRALLAEIAEVALLEEDEHGRFASHVLVRAYAEELLDTEETAGERAAAVDRLLQHYLHSAQGAAAEAGPRREPIAPAPPGVIPERPGPRWFDDHHEVLVSAVRHAAESGSTGVARQLALALPPALRRGGWFHDWQEVMRIALRCAREDGDPVGEARALCGLAGARHSFGDQAEALALLSVAEQTFSGRRMRADQAVVHALRHAVHSALGRHDEALGEIEKALTLARAMGEPRAEAYALAAKGRSLVRLGELDEAEVTLLRALAADHPAAGSAETEIRLGLAEWLRARGRCHAAAEELRKALGAARRSDDRVGAFFSAIGLADVLLAVDDVPGSCAAWREACDVMHAMQNSGTPAMLDEVYQVGGKLVKVTFQ